MPIAVINITIYSFVEKISTVSCPAYIIGSSRNVDALELFGVCYAGPGKQKPAPHSSVTAILSPLFNLVSLPPQL